MAKNFANMSMLEVEQLMLRKTPQPFRKIAKEVSELMGMSDEELKEKITRFYSDLTLSGKFVNVTGDKWDLKNRQKFEVYEHQFIFEDEDESEFEDEEIEGDDEEDLDEEDIDEEFEDDYDDADDEDLT